MRRKAGQLLDLEAQILEEALATPDVHGFALAKAIADRDGSRRLTSHGTLYKALARMEDAGLLTSRWEEPGAAEAEGRPRRRLYRVTGNGQAALATRLLPSEATDVVGVPRGIERA